MAGATVSAGYTKALLDLAVSRGADRAQLLSAAGLNARELEQSEARVPFERFKRLMREGKRLSGDPALALHFGTDIRFNVLSIVGLICFAAPTMDEAFRQMNRYGRLVIEVEGVGREDRFVVEEQGGRTYIVDKRANPNSFPELTESTLGRFICGFSRIFPTVPLYLSAEVTHTRPDYGDLYEELLGVPVQFGRERNTMEIDPAYFTMTISNSPGYVFGILSEQAEALLKRLEASDTVASEVERRMMADLHTGNISMKTIALQMGVSRQTLYRQLKQEGTSFDELLDQLRHRLAIDYLEGEKVSVNETAYLVGFSDPSAFSRAFKRWTGQRPSAGAGRAPRFLPD
ncbi:AraC family transcriptional regulator [Henriciella marina]|uniref:AraC family transcriptional regulator n=1 Tax=Henriciella marina TaxID=453851 RepID=A0ABT4LTU3_9PROT|nr:AraC family transcriptional regulator [Henriciella marina]MCZ4297623.1 AraC family transcriptional regulator [Henriciella marina]